MEKLNTGATSFLQSADICSTIELEKVAELYDTMRKETQVKNSVTQAKLNIENQLTNTTLSLTASSSLVRHEKTSSTNSLSISVVFLS